MRNFRYLLICSLCAIVASCNLFSLKNVSNDFRWKNKKFSKPLGIELEYTPKIVINIPRNREPWFYTALDSIDPDKNYNIRELLKKKFRNRNIIFKDSSAIKLRIEKLLFKEYAEDVRVYTESEYIGDSTQDFFIFEISGSLIKNDSVLQQITSKHNYNNEPRESYVFDGIIVMGGGNAKADKMIENTISEFSYRVYKSISEKPETIPNDTLSLIKVR